MYGRLDMSHDRERASGHRLEDTPVEAGRRAVNPVLALQQAVGNRAVGQMLGPQRGGCFTRPDDPDRQAGDRGGRRQHRSVGRRRSRRAERHVSEGAALRRARADVQGAHPDDAHADGRCGEQVIVETISTWDRSRSRSLTPTSRATRSTAQPSRGRWPTSTASTGQDLPHGGAEIAKLGLKAPSIGIDSAWLGYAWCAETRT